MVVGGGGVSIRANGERTVESFNAKQAELNGLINRPYMRVGTSPFGFFWAPTKPKAIAATSRGAAGTGSSRQHSRSNIIRDAGCCPRPARLDPAGIGGFGNVGLFIPQNPA